MPELPEVERTRLSLLPRLPTRRVIAAQLLRADICESFDSRARRHAPTPADLLQGAAIDRLERKGKQLAIIALDGRTLCVHLGMSGQLRFRPPGNAAPLPPHTHALWRLDDGSTLLFTDPRRFGGLRTFPAFSALLQSRWSSLGPDALSVTAADLEPACRNSRRSIKTLLLDQRTIAGVGNIYADEALFEARIHPLSRADKLRAEALHALAQALRSVLSRAIAAGGSTLRNYADSDGVRGSAQLAHNVYARAGLPCPRCSTPLASARVSQRATVWCPRCQLRPGSRRKPQARSSTL